MSNKKQKIYNLDCGVKFKIEISENGEESCVLEGFNNDDIKLEDRKKILYDIIKIIS
ncbi:hypothetical protein P5F71_07925 [Clostridium perfringens]|nr:hypothetical protein [Clostridium perfringens]